MKLQPAFNKPSNQGSVLVMTVIVTGLIGLALASYLNLVKSQNLATMRSQAWNSTLPVIEAGVEDALTHLNVNGTNNILVDGWQQYGSMYWISRTLQDGSYYFVTISNYTGPSSTSPVITSRGYVPMPVQVVSSSQMMFAATTGGSGSGYLARGVLAQAGIDALFTKGMVAKGQIDLKGNNIETDSFDSSDPNYSTGGLYDPTKNKDNGDVATNSGLVDSLSVGNAEIAGKVSTGPNGSVDVGTQGSVGSLAWIASNNGVQPGWSSDDMNINFPEVKTPWTGGAVTPGPGVVNGTPYTYVLGNGNYQLSALSMSANNTMIITGDAILYVPNNISMSGNAAIQIAPGGSLTLYGGGNNNSLGGNGVVNQTGKAEQFFYYGLPSNKSLALSGNSDFVGVIYAPDADFTLNGGGGSHTDFVGSSVTKTVTMNGHYKFHYDENLENVGPRRGYTIRGWDEMTPDSVGALTLATVLGQTYDEGETQ